MPNDYAGSSYISGSGMRPRRSFLDEEYTDDKRMRQWAEATDRIAGEEIEGSDFYQTEAADPSKKFLGAYVARKKSAGLPIDMSVDAKPMMSTEGRYVKPRLTGRQAMSFKEDFDKDMSKNADEAERLRRKAEADAEAKRLSDQRIAEARAMGELGVELEGKKRRIAKETPNFSEQASAMQIEDIGLARSERDRKKVRDEGRKSVLAAGSDIPGYTESGEQAAAQAVRQGMSVEQAEAMAAQETRADFDRLEKLESSGIPANIEAAKKLRMRDPDLRGRPSAIPERNTQQEEAFVSGKVGSFLEKLKQRADEENLTPFSSEFDPYSDIDSDVQRELATNLDEAVMQIRSGNPRLEPERIKEVITARMQARGFPQDYIDAVMAMVR